jgi:hypothetical protein
LETRAIQTFLYDKESGWVNDREHILIDRLFGYDKYEPKDSPYAIGNTDMLSRIDGITEEEAMKLDIISKKKAPYMSDALYVKLFICRSCFDY